MGLLFFYASYHLTISYKYIRKFANLTYTYFCNTLYCSSFSSILFIFCGDPLLIWMISLILLFCYITLFYHFQQSTFKQSYAMDDNWCSDNRWLTVLLSYRSKHFICLSTKIIADTLPIQLCYCPYERINRGQWDIYSIIFIFVNFLIVQRNSQ